MPSSNLVMGICGLPRSADELGSMGSALQNEKQRILDALERAGGNRALAARRLGIGRATRYRRMDAIGIVAE